MRRLWPIPVLLFVLAALAQSPAPPPFTFVILGDRTGEVQPGVWEQVLKEAAAERPAFFLGVGDTIQGLKDDTAASEWQQVTRLLAPYRRIPLYLAPGNHDVWSDASAELFPKYAHHPLHYGFDHANVHVTVLDNSRSDEFSKDEMAFLESDLTQHQSQPVKFVVSHRPSWLVSAALKNPLYGFQQLMKKYNVKYVVAGHVHQMLHTNFDGVTYYDVQSAGGHLRGEGKYEDGWFFGYTVVTVNGDDVSLRVKELKAPQGQGRATALSDWGLTGLVKR